MVGDTQAAGLDYRDFRFGPEPLAVLEKPSRPADDAARLKADMTLAEFAKISAFLGPLDSLLDIGCGLALMSVLIARSTGAKQVHLLDGAGEADKRQMGFHAATEAWFDVRLGEQVARDNLPGVDVYAHTEFPLGIRCGLVTSFKSWGHHYPVRQYLSPVLDTLVPGGHLIIDLRKGVRRPHGMTELVDAGFADPILIDETPKLDRIMLRRKP